MSRQHAGFVNDKAAGIYTDSEKGLVYHSKKAKSVHQPLKTHHKVQFGGHSRKYVLKKLQPSPSWIILVYRREVSNVRVSLFRTYKNIANYVARGGYRPDLRQAAIARASAVFKSQRPVKAEPEKKLRGNAAKKAAASE